MISEPSLDKLEQDVLLRIVAHRQHGASRGAVPVSALVTACALIAGLGVGVASAQHHQMTRASEDVVLGEDASLAPSSLLVASNLLASGP